MDGKLQGKKLNNSAQREHTVCRRCPLYLQTSVRGKKKKMQHSGEELIYNGQRECVRESRVGGEYRQREREISRQFYLTEAFYQRAHSRDRRKTSHLRVRPLL